jgi:hypothetical protein
MTHASFKLVIVMIVMIGVKFDCKVWRAFVENATIISGEIFHSRHMGFVIPLTTPKRGIIWLWLAARNILLWGMRVLGCDCGQSVAAGFVV